MVALSWLQAFVLQEAAWEVVDDCIQLYGGMGFMSVSVPMCHVTPAVCHVTPAVCHVTPAVCHVTVM